MIKNEFYKNFKKELIKQGYKKGDTILLTCDLLKFLIYFRKKNQIFDLDKFLDIFIDIIGKNGTLILNAFNWDFCKGIDFNLKNTPAMTGALSNFALKRKEFLRNINQGFLFKTIMLKKFLNHQIFLRILKHTLYSSVQMIKEINFILKKKQEKYLK